MSRTRSHCEKQSVFINHIINHNLITFGRNILIESNSFKIGLPILRQLSCLLL